MRWLGFLILIAISTLANAEESKVKSVVNLYGVTFTYGAPPWVTPGDDLLGQIKPFRDQKGPSFLLELIPSDQEFESWTDMFSVTAFRNNGPVPVSKWQMVSLNSLKQVCRGYKEETLLSANNVSLVKVYCPRVVAAVPMKGYEGGVGQVAVFAFMANGNVLINHRMEWRGPAFEISNPESWPTSQDEIDRSLSILKQAEAIGVNGIVSFPKD